MYVPGIVEAHAKAHELLVCHCQHTGEFRIITRSPDDHCHKCEPQNCQPMTRASVQGAFNFLYEQARAAVEHERRIMSFKCTEDQRNWFRANPDYEVIEPSMGHFFQKSGTLNMGGEFERGNAYASARLPGSLAVGIKRKI